jgi:Cu2+-exporting ATPase
MPTDGLIVEVRSEADSSQKGDETRVCHHCGTQAFMGGATESDESGRFFCCHGCRSAYGIIHACGLDEYYRMREAFSSISKPAASDASPFDEFDHPTFRDLYVREVDGGSQVEFYLPAVHCAACVWLIERLGNVIPGVLDVRLSLARSTVQITWQPETTPLSAIARMLDRLGYTPHAVSSATWRAVHDQSARRELGWLAVAGACAGNNMLLALALYAGDYSGMAAEHEALFRWSSTLVGLVSLIGPGRVFFRGAIGALRTRTAHLDIPLALGLGVGGVGGLINTIAGSGDLYFDSLSVLVFLLLVGRFVQSRGQRKSAESVSLLRLLTPRRAHLVESNGVRTIPIEAVAEGDVLEVRVGEIVPADGVILQGSTSIDESLLTGEMEPREVWEGSVVTAGSSNLSAVVQMRATAVGEQSRMGKLATIVAGASRERAQVLDLAHRWSGYFVIAVLMLSAVTWMMWSRVSTHLAFERVVSLLVVSCPCALGLATPLALAVAQARAARRRILIKGSEVFERLARPGRLWIDKTGTLTEGALRVREWSGRRDIEVPVAMIESHSSHPIAKSLVDAIEERVGEKVDHHLVTEVRHWQGGGITGTVNGRTYEIGSARRLKQVGWDWENGLEEKVNAFADRGWTPVVVGMDGRIVAVVGLGDEIRSEAPNAVLRLKELGWDVGILSGDHPSIVSRVGAALGIDQKNCLGGLSPEDKTRIVRLGQDQSSVVMVGDGINDSAALASASVGVAVHGGAEASMNSALVYLGEPGLGPLVELMEGSRETMFVVGRNLAASLFYNLLAAGLAVAGIIHPLMAALLMPASSLTVVTLSSATRAFGVKR